MPMFEAQLVMQEEDFHKVLAVIQRLVKDANAKGVFVVDKNGQLIGASPPRAGWLRSSARKSFRSISTRASGTTSTSRWSGPG